MTFAPHHLSDFSKSMPHRVTPRWWCTIWTSGKASSLEALHHSKYKWRLYHGIKDTRLINESRLILHFWSCCISVLCVHKLSVISYSIPCYQIVSLHWSLRKTYCWLQVGPIILNRLCLIVEYYCHPTSNFLLAMQRFQSASSVNGNNSNRCLSLVSSTSSCRPLIQTNGHRKLCPTFSFASRLVTNLPWNGTLYSRHRSWNCCDLCSMGNSARSI